jgi:hypothetical protein
MVAVKSKTHADTEYKTGKCEVAVESGLIFMERTIVNLLL